MIETADIDPAPPELPVAFDENNRPVLVTEPAVYDDAPPELVTREDLQAAIRQFLHDLTADTPALLAGQRLHVLAYLAGATDYTTQRQLAEALNVTPARISQILAALPSEWQSVARLKRRTA